MANKLPSKANQLFYSLFFALFLMTGCDKFEGDQSIPSYIRIDSIGVKITSSIQGTASASLTDAWVYVDDQLIGCFELPAVIPVLAEGKCNVKVYPGFKINGMNNTRAPHPMFNYFSFTKTLYPDSTISLTNQLINGKQTLLTTYKEACTFKWMESFADPSLSIDSVKTSETGIGLTPDGYADVFEGQFSGRIYMPDTVTYFLGTNNEDLTLPKLGRAVILELNYKTNIDVTIGMYATSTSQTVMQPLLVLSPTSTWKKIYVNLSPYVSSQSSAISYKIFFGVIRDESSSAGEILLDNIKLVHL